MQTAKKKINRLPRRLPEDCSMNDIQYHIYVLRILWGRSIHLQFCQPRKHKIALDPHCAPDVLKRQGRNGVRSCISAF